MRERGKRRSGRESRCVYVCACVGGKVTGDD